MPETDNQLWARKQSVARHIVEQLKESTEEEQKTLILKLLDQVKPEFLIALDFAYEFTPKQKRGSKGDA